MVFGDTYLSQLELESVGFRRVGLNVKLHRRASIYGVENISFGNNVRIDDFCVIVATGPTDIGNYVSIHNFCFLGTRHGLVLEDFVTIAPGVKLFTASDDYSGEFLTGPTVPREFTGGSSGKVFLRKHVIVGAGSVVLPDCTIGEGCSIGALSLVNRNLDPWGVYGGVPVRRLKERQKKLLNMECRLLASA